jgi:S1-C subfamily serine protease
MQSSADAYQLSPTSALNEEDRVEPWNEPDKKEAVVSKQASLGFLETGELPQSVDQLRAMQVRFKSLAEQVKNATVSITMRSGQGSGVLVSSDGIILTAAHVIGRPRQAALITFRDGQRARAVTLGVEAGKDTGMLKIISMLEDKPGLETEEDKEDDAEAIAPGELPAPGESAETDDDASDADGLEEESSEEGSQSTTSEKDDVITKAFASEDLPFFDYLDVGVSEGLNDGQWVMAVGHPGGLDEKRGMVVRVGRVINQNATSLRTDCTLVGGDSGGPLVDMEGNVVAIHSRIGSRIQDNIHVPVDVFLDTWDKLASGFKIGEQGRLGLSVHADSNIVSDVQKGGPADKAGIQVSDILSGIGSRNVNDKRSLARALRGRYPYEKIPIRVIRGSQKIELTAMLVDAELLELIKRKAMSSRRNDSRPKP